MNDLGGGQRFCFFIIITCVSLSSWPTTILLFLETGDVAVGQDSWRRLFDRTWLERADWSRYQKATFEGR